MLLAIDVGNTNVELGLFNDETLTQTWRLGTHGEYTSDECSAIVRSLFDMAQIPATSVKAAILSCVVPPLLPIFERTCTKSFSCQPLVVGPGMRTGMAIRVDNPPEVGADRIVNAVAAHHLVGGPVISIDFGTAITFDCVSKAGEFVTEAFFERDTLLSGAVSDMALSPDRDQAFLFMVDSVNNELRIVDRASHAVVGRVGRPGRWAGQFHVVHNVASDSQGNVYTSEVNTGQRVQKFRRLDQVDVQR